MMTHSATLFVVDDEPDVRKALARLLRSAGFDVQAFSSAAEFLDAHEPEVPGCLILDLAMPGMNGLELQQRLALMGCRRPIVFLTGKGSIPTTVQAMKAGAVDFLTKPVDGEDLLKAVEIALGKDADERASRQIHAAIKERLARLTPREHEVLKHVVTGRLNKQIAAELGTVEKTIKVHRARVMQKMGAGSLAELVQLASMAGIESRPAIGHSRH
jgi:FixJ family two-component response regulator